MGCQTKESLEIQEKVLAQVSSSVGSSFDFGEKNLANTYEKVITLTHVAGFLDAININVSKFSASSAFRYKGGSYPGIGGTCSKLMRKGDSCDIVIEFYPQVEQQWVDKISVVYNNGVIDTSFEIQLLGYGGNVAFLEVSPANYNFGVKEPNTTTEMEFIVENKGGLTAQNITPSLSNLGVFNFKGGFYPGLGGNCETSLARLTSCKIVMNFSPIAPGSFNTTLTLAYLNPSNNASTPITLNGIAASIEGDLRFADGSNFIFADTVINGSLKRKFRVSNSGYLPSTAITFSTTGTIAISSNTCTTTINVADNCEIELDFSPTITGENLAALTVNYQSGKGARTRTINLKGNGLSPGTIQISRPLPVDFGSIGVNERKDINFGIVNIGSFDITNLSIINPGLPFSIVSHNCPVKLTPLQSCLMTARIDATAVGTANGSINLNFNNGAINTSSSITLTALAKAIAVLKFDQLSYPIGTFPQGHLETKIITVTNIGINSATAITADPLFAPFSYQGGTYPGTGGNCGTTLLPSNSCQLQLAVQSASAGNFFSSILLRYFNSESTVNANVTASAIYLKVAKIEAVDNTANPLASIDFGKKSLINNHSFRVTLKNTGAYTANFTSVLSLSDTTAGFSLTAPVLKAGENIGNCLLLTSLEPLQDCGVQVIFSKTVAATYTSNLTLNFQDISGTYSMTVPITAEAQAMADIRFVSVSPSTPFTKVAKDGFQLATFTYRNFGQTTANNVSINSVTAPFSINSTNCTPNLTSGTLCTITIRFAPTSLGLFNLYSKIKYDSSGVIGIEEDLTILSALGVSPGKITISPGTSWDFGFSVIGTPKNKVFIISNTGGADASSIVFSGLGGAFSLTTNTCPTLLEGFETCTITITFTPPDVANLHQSNFYVSYNNGVTNITNNPSLAVKGIGEPPLSIHKGWSDITAWGNRVNVMNISSADASVKISWNTMIPTSGTITAYSVFRRLATDTDFDFSNPIATGISTSTRTYTDSSVVPGTVYFYTVRPIILGAPSRILESFGLLRVIAPPNNMALVHRWAANQVICTKLGLPVNNNINHGCYYSGLGSNTLGQVDQGQDLLVDRFETGTDNTPRTGQLPNTNLSQPGAWSACQGQSNIELVGLGSGYKKRLLTRREFNVASYWPANLTPTQILNKENGSTPSSDCNGNGTGYESTGTNLNCLSRFGIENMAGNAWEWVSDRTQDGIGITDSGLRLDPDNTDLDGIDFTTYTNNTFSSYACFSEIFGLPFPIQGGGACGDYLTSSTYGTANFHNDYIFAPGASGLRVMLSGGGFSSAQYPGRLTVGFFSGFMKGAARCGFGVN